MPQKKSAQRAAAAVASAPPPPSATARKPNTSAKTATRLAVVPNDPAALLRQYVDELGTLERELIEVRPKLRRVEVLHDLIRERFNASPAGLSLETRGERYGCTLGARAFRSTLDYDAIRKHLGLKTYAEIARPTLKDVELKLPPEVLARVVKYDYTGARPIKTFELAK